MSFIPNPDFARELKHSDGVRDLMDEVGSEALEFARGIAPVDSGTLRDSLAVERIEEGGVRLTVNVDYWGFPEFGTENMPANPYLRPTLTGIGLEVTS